ncbi:hypothetical protein [Nostoc sp. LEGE 12450]|uniref:hypothetical protein n=1 Tax=Nostoc sp. LEGE 12450 TaxID=1828643 RepID=UPI0018812727|nr:hypothetical protein [Nostoc sp. LEGE 12450]MBE8991433.1 hypothetical protein [Nostoc sp. LEGE 12450]
MTSSTNFNTLSTLIPDINTPHSDICGTSPLDFRHPHSRSSAPIYGTPGNDVITAQRRSIVFAGEGVNLITTGLGNDVIYSGGSSDFIDAGGGKNTIFTGEGNNRILSRNRSDWNLHLRRYLDPSPDYCHGDSLLCAEYRLVE